MPAGEPETAASAGVSAPEQVDVAALFERLKEEVRHAPGLDVSDGFNRGLVRTRLRSVAERWWPVTAERPLDRRPGLRGALLYPVKKVLRRLMRFYVEPFAAAQPAAAALPDYFAFEARMRGRSDEIRERQRAYVEDFRDAAPVLDVGCGRAELVGLLLEAGVEARGVDADADMVAFAQGEGLPVEQADLLAHLETLEDGSLGGIFAGQVVEHLPPPALVCLLQLAAAKLRPGGVLVAETINPLSPLALRYYFADLTHAQPLVPETLELLARQAGFRDTELRYLNAPEERLREVELEDDAAREALAANIRRLNEILFAPLDYALLART